MSPLGAGIPGLTDQLPPKVSMAIGPKDWAPQRSGRGSGTGIRIVRFTDSLLRGAIETHVIEGVSVNVFGMLPTSRESGPVRRDRGAPGGRQATHGDSGGNRSSSRQGRGVHSRAARSRGTDLCSAGELRNGRVLSPRLRQ